MGRAKPIVSPKISKPISDKDSIFNPENDDEDTPSKSTKSESIDKFDDLVDIDVAILDELERQAMLHCSQKSDSQKETQPEIIDDYNSNIYLDEEYEFYNN